MKKTLAEIAKIVDGEVIGDKSLVITGFNSMKEAREGDLTFLGNAKYVPFLKKTKASAILVTKDVIQSTKPLIKVVNPSLAFSQIIESVTNIGNTHPQGIHPGAFIANGVNVGKNVSIGAFASIEEGSVIGDHSIIYAHTYVGPQTRIGRNCIIYPHVTIREKTEIGNRVIIHSGTVIGSDGFGYETVGGVHKKISQIGIVVLEDDVEIGANVTIDRARFDKTIIGKGTKIDNLVQVAHNCRIGENCIIIAQVGISGTTTIEKNCILAGQVGTIGHLTIGENSVVASRSVVTKSLPKGSKVLGNPAQPILQEKKIHAHTQRLPRYVEIIKELQKKVAKLEAKLQSQKEK
jgi:UDP-3-O-[3-hydroxymyristoyl] glucosamine N-acyltransferase